MAQRLVGAVIGLPLLALVFVPLERRFALRRGEALRPGWRTDAAYFVLRPILQIAGLVAAVAVAVAGMAAIVPAFVVRPAVVATPMWLRALLAFVVFDFIAYWAHRLSHEVPYLWRFHSIHHSSERVDWLATVRDHPLERALVGVPVVFLVFAGFPLLSVISAFAVVHGLGALWAHMNVRWRLRPLQKVIITPAVHQWHHAIDADAINHNYAAGLPIWDVLFGTFFAPVERVPSGYGCNDPIPDGLGAQLMYPLRRKNPAQPVADPV